MKFSLLRFTATPLVVFQVDEFVKIEGIIYLHPLCYLIEKFNNSDNQIRLNFICIIHTLVNTMCVGQLLLSCCLVLFALWCLVYGSEMNYNALQNRAITPAGNAITLFNDDAVLRLKKVEAEHLHDDLYKAIWLLYNFLYMSANCKLQLYGWVVHC